MSSQNNNINTLLVNTSSGDPAIQVDSEGNTIIKKLFLIDDVTGNKWELRVSNGNIIVEPVEIEDKREKRIDSILT
jgi:hypothetical protein